MLPSIFIKCMMHVHIQLLNCCQSPERESNDLSSVRLHTCTFAHQECEAQRTNHHASQHIIHDTIIMHACIIPTKKQWKRLSCYTLMSFLMSRAGNSMNVHVSKLPAPQIRSFYRRALPPSCTALSSKEGRALFESSLAHKGLKSFFQLMEQL